MKRKHLFSLFFYIIYLIYMKLFLFIPQNSVHALHIPTGGEKNTTLSNVNTTECKLPASLSVPSINEFPPDFFSQEQRTHGAVIFHIIVSVYCFAFIAYVCNDYFLPSVYCICQGLQLSPDVAGATFMAFATSAPELFVNLIGTFITKSDLGVGDAFGSGICNILGVTACAGLVTSQNIRLEVWPLLRESCTYIVVIAILAVILADGVVTTKEALLLLVLYFLYIILMFTQKIILSFFNNLIKTKKNTLACNSNSSKTAIFTTSAPIDPCYGTYRTFCYLEGPAAEKATNQTNNNTNEKSKIDEEAEKSKYCAMPEGFGWKIWWVMSRPVIVILYITIPDCKIYRKIYPLTFIMCIVWIGISTYVLSWMISIMGYTFNINDAVMGMTFIAIGGSIPEAASAIVNARNGVGSMSISNALGANTIDILLCLGGPWFVKTLLPASLDGGSIHLETTALTFNCFCLIACVVTLNVITFCNSFQMNRLFGILCLFAFIISMILLVLADMNILFNFASRCS